MLVCHCHRVSEAAVDQVMTMGASKVGQVVRATRAGTACGGCLPHVQQLCRAAIERRVAPALAAPAAEQLGLSA